MGCQRNSVEIQSIHRSTIADLQTATISSALRSIDHSEEVEIPHVSNALVPATAPRGNSGLYLGFVYQ